MKFLSKQACLTLLLVGVFGVAAQATRIDIPTPQAIQASMRMGRLLFQNPTTPPLQEVLLGRVGNCDPFPAEKLLTFSGPGGRTALTLGDFTVERDVAFEEQRVPEAIVSYSIEVDPSKKWDFTFTHSPKAKARYRCPGMPSVGNVPKCRKVYQDRVLVAIDCPGEEKEDKGT